MTGVVRERAAGAVREAAALLLGAQARRVEVSPLTDERPDLDVATAYAIQDEALATRLARGERVVGVKLGLTSRAKQERMGVREPIVAWLTDAMLLPAGAPLPLDTLIHPRVEPELVFLMSDRLAGPGVTAPAALAAVGAVYAGAEVIDSRFRDFRFTLPDVIADNASAAVFTVGTRGRRPAEVDLALEACLVEVDGAVTDSATGAAILGDPAQALALAANLLGARGHAIEAGWIVLCGALTDAVPVGPATRVAFEYTSLGRIDIPVAPAP